MRRDPDPDPDDYDLEIDLHGMRPDDAIRRLGHELRTAQVRHYERVLVITGRGWGNLEQKPILRPRVEAWLKTPEARNLGVREFRVVSKGGALDVTLLPPGAPEKHPTRRRDR